MALSGLDIYKLLPKTNCRECGFVTCLAFAMQLAKKAVGIDKCPYVSEEAKRALEAASQPPIRLVIMGEGDNKVEVGNETVLFRHEEKFHHPSALGFIIEDNLPDDQIKERLQKINALKFERVGQELRVNIVAIRQNGSKERFVEAVKFISANTSLALILMSEDHEAQREALKIVALKRPLLYLANEANLAKVAVLAKEFNVPLAVSDHDLGTISQLTSDLNAKGINDLVLTIGKKAIHERIWDLTQIRRQALKKSNRSLGYPVLVVTSAKDPYEEAIEAATFIAKYAGIVLIKGIESWEALSILTLRQNIYTDPQKPLQIEPKLYSVGQVKDNSPVLVTTNFSLTYYTVLGEVEASKVPAYIMSVDTEGMSVLTAWAAEKFTPEKITEAISKFGVAGQVSRKQLIIPGYVAVISGELEEKSGWQITVGPKEASGLPGLLKKL